MGPTALAAPLQLTWLKKITHLLGRFTPWVDTIGATAAIFDDNDIDDDVDDSDDDEVEGNDD